MDVSLRFSLSTYKERFASVYFYRCSAAACVGVQNIALIGALLFFLGREKPRKVRAA